MSRTTFNLDICKIIYCLSLEQFRSSEFYYKAYKKQFGGNHDDFCKGLEEAFKKNLIFEVRRSSKISTLHLTRSGFKLGELMFENGIILNAGRDNGNYTIYKNKRSCLRYLYDLRDCYHLPNFINSIYLEIKELYNNSLGDVLIGEEIQKFNIFYQKDNGDIVKEINSEFYIGTVVGIYNLCLEIAKMVTEGYELNDIPTIVFEGLFLNKSIDSTKGKFYINKLFENLNETHQSESATMEMKKQYNYINRQILFYYTLKKDEDVIYVAFVRIFDTDGDLVNIFITRDLQYVTNRYKNFSNMK